MKKFAVIILFLLVFSLSSEAQAQCWISSISHVNFGNILPSSLLISPQDTIGNIVVVCFPIRTVTISISPGQSGNCNQRRMRYQNEYLNYNLYTNSARTIIWGDGTCGSTVTTSVGFWPVTVYIYGRVPQGQDVAVGGYSDTVTITVRWTGGSTAATLNVSANILPECKFRTNQTAINVTLDPNIGSNVTGSSTLSFWCARRTNYTVTDDRGQYNYRVKHASLPEYIPYTLSYNPTTGTGGGAQNPITLNISATFVGSDYINAVVGAYTDTVTLIVNP